MDEPQQPVSPIVSKDTRDSLHNTLLWFSMLDFLLGLLVFILLVTNRSAFTLSGLIICLTFIFYLAGEGVIFFARYKDLKWSYGIAKILAIITTITLSGGGRLTGGILLQQMYLAEGLSKDDFPVWFKYRQLFWVVFVVALFVITIFSLPIIFQSK